MKKLLSIFLAFLICSQAVAQSARDSNAVQDEGNPAKSPEYEPYSDDEFPDWLHEVRRAEVVLIGSFPLSMLFSSLVYEGARALKNAVEGNQTAGTQASGNGFSQEETKGILISGTILSVAVAVVDFILGRLGTSKK